MGLLHHVQVRHARLTWLSTMLVLLLQRTPVLRLLVTVDPGSSLRSAQLLRALVPATVAAGVVNTLTGATRFVANPPSPASATAGAPFSMAFAVTGAPSTPKSYSIDGPLPAGLTVPGASVSGTQRTLNASSGTISGTPTESGGFTVSIRAYAGTNRSGDKSPIYSYTLNVTGGGATAPPVFTMQPQSQTVVAGATVTFTVSASGSPAPTYQWRKNGSNLAGQAGATLTLGSVSSGDAGNYTCVATNTAGTATSTTATLTVNAATAPPVFTIQPQSQTVVAGASVTFTVSASGSPAPTYQWRKNGSNLAGQTGATLTLSNVDAGDAGTYSCVAGNSAGSATSADAVLTLAAAAGPTIVTQPEPMTTRAGGGAFFAVQASGSGLTYQWTRDGSPLPGATLPSYSLLDVPAAAAGHYAVTVRDGSGNTVDSDAVALTVVSIGSARLLNLSTRAGVGVATPTVIPGFVIEGDVALTVLVRAVGPGLADYEVPGFLSDPVMTLYRGSAVLAGNDDWEDVPNPAEVQAAMEASGAFPLLSGSKDAALLITLNPGAYTVHVTGRNGAAGEALVELYVVEP